MHDGSAVMAYGFPKGAMKRLTMPRWSSRSIRLITLQTCWPDTRLSFSCDDTEPCPVRHGRLFAILKASFQNARGMGFRSSVISLMVPAIDVAHGYMAEVVGNGDPRRSEQISIEKDP